MFDEVWLIFLLYVWLEKYFKLGWRLCVGEVEEVDICYNVGDVVEY